MSGLFNVRVRNVTGPNGEDRYAITFPAGGGDTVQVQVDDLEAQALVGQLARAMGFTVTKNSAPAYGTPEHDPGKLRAPVQDHDQQRQECIDAGRRCPRVSGDRTTYSTANPCLPCRPSGVAPPVVEDPVIEDRRPPRPGHLVGCRPFGRCLPDCPTQEAELQRIAEKYRGW